MDISQNNNNNSNSNGRNAATPPWDSTRFMLFIKRQLRLNRFLLVIDTKKGVVISAVTVIVVDLIDLIWNLSMAFGPLSSTMTTLLLIETFLVICVSSFLLYTMKTQNKSDLRPACLAWLLVVAIDYLTRAAMIILSLAISEKASTTAKLMKLVASVIMLALVAHCWQCVFTYYDENNGKITTVKITPSDERGRPQFHKRQLMMLKTPIGAQEQPAERMPTSAAAAAQLGAASGVASNMLCAPSDDTNRTRW